MKVIDTLCNRKAILHDLLHYLSIPEEKFKFKKQHETKRLIL